MAKDENPRVRGDFPSSVLGARLGDKTTFTDRFEIDKGVIKRFAEVLQDPNPLFWDEEYAKKSSYGGIIAPPTLIFEWNHHTAVPNETSIPLNAKGDTDAEGLGWAVRGANEIEIIEPLRPGTVLNSSSEVVEVTEKEGKSGKLVFVTSETKYTDQNGKLLAIGQEIVIARPQS